MSARVSIILVNYNGWKDTVECVNSLNQINYDNYEIIVVDNASEGDDLLRLNNYEFKNVYFIKSSQNLGFSGGNNLGIEHALNCKSDFILLLNNDTIVQPDFLTTMVSKTEDSTIGVVTPMIKYFDRRDTIWSAGGEISKIRASGFTYGFNKNENEFSADLYCTFASGCCMLIKSEVIKKVGMLDPNYFLYLEDTDYSFRIINAGYKIYYAASSVIYHKVTATTSKDNKLLPLYYSVRNRLYFAKKNLGWFYILALGYLSATFFLKYLLYNFGNKEYKEVLVRSFSDYYNKKLGKTDFFDLMKNVK